MIVFNWIYATGLFQFARKYANEHDLQQAEQLNVSDEKIYA